MSYNFLTVGSDCSPAYTLRNLNLREYALPFDWNVSYIDSLERCFREDFRNYHKNLKLNDKKDLLVDEYGFKFPHDYPKKNADVNESELGEGVIRQTKGTEITEKWSEYHDIVLEKYSRRIERFRQIMKDTKPIVVLCRYRIYDVLRIQKFFAQYYNKTNVYFVNSCAQSYETDKIKNVFTERNQQWNEAALWKEGIDAIIKKIEL